MRGVAHKWQGSLIYPRFIDRIDIVLPKFSKLSRLCTFQPISSSGRSSILQRWVTHLKMRGDRKVTGVFRSPFEANSPGDNLKRGQSSVVPSRLLYFMCRIPNEMPCLPNCPRNDVALIM